VVLVLDVRKSCPWNRLQLYIEEKVDANISIGGHPS